MDLEGLLKFFRNPEIKKKKTTKFEWIKKTSVYLKTKHYNIINKVKRETKIEGNDSTWQR